MIWSYVQAWGGHWEFQDSARLFQNNTTTRYHSILFSCTVDVVLLFCYGLSSLYVKIPRFW